MSELKLDLHRRRIAQILVALAMLLIALVYLRWQGRIGWCACGSPKVISLNVSSMHNSQHLFDAYTLSHVLHGVLFFGVFWFLRKRWSFGGRLLAAMAIEVAWEMMENSPIIIDRYRAATVSLGYTGDSIVNSTGDVISFVAGYYLAARLGLKRSIVFFLAVELFMLWLIRDNLALNVLMLLWPIDAIRRWQSGG